MNHSHTLYSIFPPILGLTGMVMIIMSSGFWNKNLFYVLRLSFFAGLGGFIHGYYSGVMNNFLPYTLFIHNPQEIVEETRWMFLHGFGSWFPLWTGGVMISGCRGREEPWQSVTFHSPFFVVGAFLIVRLPEVGAFGWLILGYGSGQIFVAVTIYLAENSPPRIRGAIVATFFFQIAAGQIVYYLISLVALFLDYSSIDDDKRHLEKWHWMLGIIPVLFIFKLKSKNWFPQYSPSCLYALGRKKEATELLRKTRPSVEDVAREVEVLELAVKNIDLDNRLPYINMIAGTACLVAEHLVGMNMVMYYTPRIVVHVLQLEQYSSSSKYLMLATLLIKSVLSAIGTLFCIAFVDRYGRRRLLLLSIFGIITCLGFLSFALYGCSSSSSSTIATVDVITASCRITGNDGMENLGSLVLGALGFYFIFHSMGLGTIPWIINSEIYPLRDRILYGMRTSATYWFIGIWMMFLYGYLDQVISQYNMGIAFSILCLSSCVACCMVYIFAPETKGYPIEEVETLIFLEEKMWYDLNQRQVILTSKEEIPYMFSSPSSSDDE